MIQFKEAISYGVVKVNLDTDLQWANLVGVRNYILNKKDYLASQVGNPEGEDKRMCMIAQLNGPC